MEKLKIQELILEIISFLELEDLLSISLTCKSWYELQDSDVNLLLFKKKRKSGKLNQNSNIQLVQNLQLSEKIGKNIIYS
jgi:hypothetical protein